ncbi:cupin domain-containing protein [Chitinimonas sp.]|uniref:cupin domain-containing protein n=1 Tax=Chitinimonas sp. TaxID=1934313 RepID=UPI002F932217
MHAAHRFYFGLATLLAGGTLALADTPQLQRKLLLSEPSAQARVDVVQAEVTIPVGGVAPLHTHPGDEASYVISGTVELRVGDKPPIELTAGQAFHIPAGVPHSARVIGEVPVKLAGTWFVAHGQALATPVPAAQ